MKTETIICEEFGYKWGYKEVKEVAELMQPKSEGIIEALKTFVPESIINLAMKKKDYILVDNSLRLKEVVKELGKAEVLAIDTETTGLDPHQDKLRLIQIATANQVYLIDCFKCKVGLLQPVLTNKAYKVFHNAKFDIQFLMSEGLEVSQTIFDTQIAYQLLTAGKQAKYSLKETVKTFLDIELNKDAQVSDWSGDLTEAQLEYACIDAKILLPLREKLKLEIVKKKLHKVAKIEFDCVVAVAMMEFNGMLLDVPRWQNILKSANTRKEELAIELQDYFQKNIDRSNTTHQINLFGTYEPINLDSPQQVMGALKGLGIDCPDSNSDTLKRMLPDYPQLAPLLEYRKVSKIVSSFGEALLSKINPKTGRLHGNYWQLGSQSGRMTSSNPNLQQIPREKAFRSCFIAPPNHKLIIADYSQIELRIAAELTNDKTMLKAYQNGEDLHKLTASIVLNKPLDEVIKDDRQIAKSANFGLIYGASVNGFRSYAESNYGIRLSEKKADTIRANFFKSYNGLGEWHKATKHKVYNQELEFTRTLGDRIRYFETPSPQQALNTPVQGTGADILKLALGKLVLALKPFNAKIIAVVHDEIVLEVLESVAEEVSKILQDMMVFAGKEFLRLVPVEVDVTIADSWAEK